MLLRNNIAFYSYIVHHVVFTLAFAEELSDYLELGDKHLVFVFLQLYDVSFLQTVP